MPLKGPKSSHQNGRQPIELHIELGASRWAVGLGGGYRDPTPNPPQETWVWDKPTR